MPIGDALLDQKILAGVGNVIRSEVCFIERVDPFRPVADVDEGTRRGCSSAQPRSCAPTAAAVRG